MTTTRKFGLLFIAISTLFLTMCFTGCRTSSTGRQEVDPNVATNLGPVVEGTVASAVVYAYSRNPGTKAIVDAIRGTLYEFALSSNMSPAMLQMALTRIPIDEMKTTEAQLIMIPILTVYKSFADPKVKAGVLRDPGMVLLIMSVVDGLDQGLAAIASVETRSVRAVRVDGTKESLRVITDALASHMKRRGKTWVK